MALYDVRCVEHGEVQIFARMTDAMNHDLKCDKCGARAERIFKPGTADHSENTFKTWYSEQLTQGTDPVYVKSRAEQAAMQREMGLMRWEPGMKSEGAKLSEERRKRRENRQREVR